MAFQLKMGEWNGGVAKELFKMWRKLKDRWKNKNIDEEIENTNTKENQSVRREENDDTETEENNIIGTEGGVDNTDPDKEFQNSN